MGVGLTCAAFSLALTLPVLSRPAMAQTAATGSVQGDVKDSLGRPLSGVALQLQGADGSTVAQATSDAQGHFTFSGVPAGTYAVTATKAEFQPASAIVTVSAGGAATTNVTMAAIGAIDLKVAARRLEQARTGISPETGSSVYHVDQQAIQQLPRGDKTPINEVMLQSPGVVQDTYGQLHVRGDHGNVQYRINGLILPEGITGFGETLDTRFADRIDLLTGALPAQYGYRTAGVIDIHTKSGALNPGGSVDLFGGYLGNGLGDVEPSFQVGGSQGSSDFYLNGSLGRNDIGIGAPSADFPVHDQLNQGKGFGFASQLLTPTTKLSAILGTSVQSYQIPTLAGATTSFAVTQGGQTYNQNNYSSSKVNDVFSPTNHYGILALQGSAGDQTDYQLSLFTRYSGITFTPDTIGDLLYRGGVASTINRWSLAGGLQGDAAYRVNPSHTLRVGTFVSGENATINNTSQVFNVDANGNPTSTTPVSITDNNSLNAQLYGLYAQDEWKLLDQLTLNLGLRFDDMEGFVSTNQLSPRVGVVFKPLEQTTLHAGYARYFTPPSTELISLKSLSLFQGTTNAIQIDPNQVSTAVLPERDNYYDIGISQKIGTPFTVGLDAYYKDAQAVQDEGQFQQSPVYSNFNYAQGQVGGVELTTAFRQQDLGAYLNVAWAQAFATKVLSGQYNFAPDDLSYIASNWIHMDHDQGLTASAGVNYTLFGTTLGVDGLYGSGLRNGPHNTTTLPPYTQFNLSVARSVELPWFGRYDLRGAVINLLDTVYQLRDNSGIGVSANVYGPRRGFYLGIGKPF
jgi:outer membrane receptor protein involved in Fe transport